MGEAVFALDIGTRKVAGLLLVPVSPRTGKSRGSSADRDAQYRIVAAEVFEQAPGAMLDGQIHDVRRVAATIGIVKDLLQKKTGRPLERAAVAAAGRSLLVSRGRARQSLYGTAVTDQEQIRVLVLQAIQNATAALAVEHGKKAGAFLCVGYSVVGYLLDGERIGDLFGQRGQEAAVEVIATFLPRLVVESLNAALAGAGLSAANLTLEPIAALNAAVPASMRQLNLVLVDVGAGTSDIAVTQGGTVVGYGMVPLAGDEVTERLMEEFLLDFAEAERLKRSLGSISRDRSRAEPMDPYAAATFPVLNVLGQTVVIDAREVLAVLAPAVDAIASEVGAVIRGLNGRPPQAVILVGGGSLTPGIGSALAKALNLPASRVAARDRDALPEVSGLRSFSGPQTVTPIGIALSALRRESLEFYEVTVNARPVRILQAAGAMVGEALLGAGFSARDLVGRPGAGLSVEVNGRVVTVPGSLGRPAPLQLNGRGASLETRVGEGDAIEVGKPERGEDAQATVLDVIRLFPGFAAFAEAEAAVRCRVNDQPLLLPASPPTLAKNGDPTSLSDAVRDGDKLSVSAGATRPTVRDALAKAGLSPSAQGSALTVRVNGSLVQLSPSSSGAPVVNGRHASPDALLADGDDIRVRLEQRFILSDLFRHPLLAEFSGRAEAAPGQSSRVLTLRVNGEPAGFTTPLSDGDDVTISW